MCILLLFLASHLAIAQRISGTLRGQVSDPTGNVVAGATVTAINQDSGVSQTTVTNSAGTYIYPDLLPGSYTVKVSSQGFSESVSRDVHVVTNVDTDRNVALQVGGASETIEVTTAADTVDLTSSTISSTFNSKEVIDLPSGSASPLQLSIFSANTTAQQGGVLGSGGSVAGQRPRMNSFSIDGIDDNDTGVTGNRSNVIQDAVSEFNLVTNPFSAEYGHSGAGQFNIITKSGTNRWHGSVEDYLQNRNLNALGQPDESRTASRRQLLTTFPALDVNRVGGTIGGPILKNRWFFFGAYEYYNQRAGRCQRSGGPSDRGWLKHAEIAGSESANRAIAFGVADRRAARTRARFRSPMLPEIPWRCHSARPLCFLPHHSKSMMPSSRRTTSGGSTRSAAASSTTTRRTSQLLLCRRQISINHPPS